MILKGKNRGLSAMDDPKFDGLLIDTSIFDANGLRLEKGLLSKLAQFRRSPIQLLMPDVIRSEIKAHLERKAKEAKGALEKAINEANDHLLPEDEAILNVKHILPEEKSIAALMEKRLNKFIEMTGAVEIECGSFVDVSMLMKKYFLSEAPFSETAKKKSEFPDAIALMAIDRWAENNDKKILVVSKDDDWVRYCGGSDRLHCIKDLSDGLALLNEKNAPYAFLSRLELALEAESAQTFLNGVERLLGRKLNGITPDQHADSYLFWEPEGISVWFEGFHLTSNQFRLIESGDGYVVLEGSAAITIGAEGEFSLSLHDSTDNDYVFMDSVTANTQEEFESRILVTVSGNLEGRLEGLTIEDVEVLTLPNRVHFGSVEPNFGNDVEFE